MSTTIQFWESYLAGMSTEDAASAADRYYGDFQIGESASAADRNVERINNGTKKAVCWLWWSMQAEGRLPPRSGELAIVNGGDGSPAVVIEFTEVRTVDFSLVDEQFALDYDEWDRSVKTWRKRMWVIFGEQCRELGLNPAESMPLVCARFRAVHRQ